MRARLHRLSVPLLLAASCSPESEPARYSFFLDGESIEPEIVHVMGEPGAPRDGDLVRVERFTMVLDGPGEYRYRTSRHGNLCRLREDGIEVLVALSLGDTAFADFEEVSEPAELRNLRLGRGWAQHAELLMAAPLDRCLIEIGVFSVSIAPEVLPGGIAYLDLSYANGAELNSAATLPHLRYLALAGWGNESEVEVGPDEQRPARSIDWITELSDLRCLDVSGTGIRDLRPLGGHPQLRFLRADDVPVIHLPIERIPKLRRFDALNWTCAADEVARFRELQPDAQVVVGPNERLRDRLKDCTGLRVVTPFRFGPGRKQVPPRFISEEPAEVAELVALLSFEDEYSVWGYDVPAGANVVFEFLNERGTVVGLLEFIGDDFRLARGYGLIGSLVKETPSEVRTTLVAWFGERGASF